MDISGFDLTGCLCATSFWIPPGIFIGLAIVAGLYFGNSRQDIKSKSLICMGWVFGAIIGGAIGSLVRHWVLEIINKSKGSITIGSFIDIFPDLIGLLILGLILGLIGSYSTFTNLDPISRFSSDSDAA